MGNATQRVDVLAVFNTKAMGWAGGISTSTVRQWLKPWPTPRNPRPRSPMTQAEVLRSLKKLAADGKIVCLGHRRDVASTANNPGASYEAALLWQTHEGARAYLARVGGAA